MRTFRLVCFSVVIAAACSGAETPGASDAAQTQEKAAVDVAAVRQAIEATNARLIADFKEGDAAGVASHYTADGVIMAPSAPAMRGPAAITSGLGELFKQITVTNFQLAVEEVSVTGDVAVETGTWQMTVQPKAGGPPAPDNGKYIVVWKQQSDGSWKLHRDIWNSDNPPPAGH
jgi:uncharacterized protein (TIGR02246 family)